MKIFKPFLAVLLLGLACSRLHADTFEAGTPVSHTPYDAYMGPMYTVFGHLGEGQPDMAVVESLMREGRGFRYYFNSAQPYVPQAPEDTDKIHAGDCKAKSLWLAYKMDTRKIRFMIGKFRSTSTCSHAWLLWNGPNGWLVLDATNYSQPLGPGQVSATQFIPQYCYTTGGKFSYAASAENGGKYGDH